MRLKFLCEVQQTIWTRGRKAQTKQLNVKTTVTLSDFTSKDKSTQITDQILEYSF